MVPARPAWPPKTAVGWSLALVLIWSLVALAQAGQAQLVTEYRGSPQAWWPSLGYAAAIYSIWALLSWPVIGAVLAIHQWKAPRWTRLAAYLLLWPPTAASHISLFALLYWPLYRSEATPTRSAMADAMFVRNFDTNSVFYAVLVAATLIWQRARQRQANEGAATPKPGVGAVEIRNRGHLTRIAPERIDWIGAAGDYAEIHMGGETRLIDESLTSLARQLPADDFARIHRGTLVRVDRIDRIVPLGRGDALVCLSDGQELRLSRRYRRNLASLITAAPPPA
ncbi:MAG: LytTR family DNA-binding domain-containing protein [Sphingopyxis sp.]|uniref:LytR/AlgR family response regulator transcription factor n=1 Tax=Sphingopyxis sp. TaxID=1908224 RepID=UPI002AB8A9B3|nr:LytTR family DNA-binding domain-containing protein [Sphingopyxis sp.]MDZ3831562.1 LytTR family DNA-binding domain-containing protein [Sphingopyxis sp.]